MWKMYELGSIWTFQCQNESCPAHEANLPESCISDDGKIQGVRDKLCIGSWLSSYGGHATASKVFSFLGLYTWNDNFELTNLCNSDLCPTGKYSVFPPRSE